jgi:hypothetical protein
MSEDLEVRRSEWSIVAAQLVTREEAAHVRYAWEIPGGTKPDLFTSHLINAIMSADDSNLALLATIYPGYVAAVLRITHEGSEALDEATQDE